MTADRQDSLPSVLRVDLVMHERNLYKTPPDFESLARAYPPLRPQYTFPLTDFASSY